MTDRFCQVPVPAAAKQDRRQAVAQAATWWPVLLIALRGAIAGVALFG